MKRLIVSILLLISFGANAQNNLGNFWGLLQRGQIVQPPCPNPPCPEVNLVFTPVAQNSEYPIPGTSPQQYYPRYGGPSRWNTEDGAKIVPNLNETCYYIRLVWNDVEDRFTPGNYSKLWSDPSNGGVGRMRERVTIAANMGMLFAFGIMQFYPEVCNAGGFATGYFYGSPSRCGSYPEYVHNLMQGNGNSDWNDFEDGTSWIPAYNNPNYQARFLAMHQGIRNWIDTAVITCTAGPRNGQTVNVRDMLAYVDIRGHGSYGEWHNCCIGTNQQTGRDLSNLANYPGVVLSITSPDPDEAENGCFNGSSTIVTYGKYPTPATMINTINAQVDTYSPYPCVIIINALDGWRFCNTKISPQVASHIVTKRNAAGVPIGFRRDQWGDFGNYYDEITQNNNQTWGAIGPFKDSIMIRYRETYFTGEMPGYSNCQFSEVCRNGVLFGWLPDQAQRFHPTWVGNGNFGGNAPTNQSSVDSILKFYRLNGPRILPVSGKMTDILQSGSSFRVELSWENRGNSVIHRAWTTQIIIKNSGGTTVFTGTTPFQVKGFQLTGGVPQVISTNFTLGAVTPGTGYSVYLRLVDPLNYAQPFYLGIQNTRGSDGAYLIRSNVTISAGP